MAEYVPLDVPDNGKLAHNITHFARALRAAGIPIGPGRILDAIEAVRAAGFSDRDDFFYTLQACFINRADQRVVFTQTFRLFWRDPQFLDHMMSLLLPAVHGVQEDRPAKPGEKRAAQALLDGTAPVKAPDRGDEDDVEIEIDAAQTMSAQQRLRNLDFEQMSIDEMTQAKRILANLRMSVPQQVSRRTIARRGDMPDWRATLRRANRRGGNIDQFVTRARRPRLPNLVVLCDISGSMSAYSRAVLHFVHAVANQRTNWGDVHAFTFGTQLTNITRHLRTRDVDAALAAAGAQAQDWEGGTRIASSLATFNRDWSRRVLGAGACVLLITDGLDRDSGGGLARAMQRLALSSRQLIWINPLMRWAEFAPKAHGIRAMMPHVTSFRAGHNIASLEGLAEAIGAPHDSGDKARMMAMLRDTTGKAD